MKTRPKVATITTDFLVIGGGAASCLAAMEAAKYGNVVLMDKGKLGRSGSNPSSGGQGVAASFGHFDIATRKVCPGDSPEKHYNDTVVTGVGLSDPSIAAAVVEGICSRVLETEQCGVRYGKTEDGKYFLQRGGFGHSHPRITLCGSGWDFMEGLAKEEYFRDVQVLNFCMAVQLLVVEGRCAGALGYGLETGTWIEVRASAVFLTSGSATGLQKYASSCYRTTGDTFALAWEAGVQLADMEFMEFTMVPAPNGVVIPTSGISPYIGRGAIFYNAEGERFMERYDPVKLERGTRSKLVQAVYEEMQSGRGPCYLDATVYGDALWDEFEREEPDVIRKIKRMANPRKERVQWVPALHSYLGGVYTDRDGVTNLPGLYAGGEAGAGMHGANRLGGNAVAHCFVTGYRAVKHAVEYVRANGKPNWEVINSERDVKDLVANRVGRDDRGKGNNLHWLERELREVAWQCIGIVRNEEKLVEGINKFRELRELPVVVREGKEFAKLLGLRNLCLTGELTAMAALERKESRGQHKRSDYPNMVETWTKRIVLQRGKPIRVVPVEQVAASS